MRFDAFFPENVSHRTRREAKRSILAARSGAHQGPVSSCLTACEGDLHQFKTTGAIERLTLRFR
jgi:hypothetical protein